MIEEITAAIMNALERGYSLEQAKKSLINAGYNPNEVNEASNGFSGATNIIAQQTINQPLAPTEIQKNEPYKPIYPEGRKRYGLVIFLVFVLLLLSGILVASFFFKDELIKFVSDLGI